MSIKLESIGQIINPKDKFIILAGAGISKAPPSNLPTGIDFINSFYNFLVSKNETSQFESKLQVLKSHKSLRFENIMSLIYKNTLVKIQPLLDCYKDCDSFNENHSLLAILGKVGHIIATTNFDSLIERAYITNGIIPNPIIYDEDYKTSHSIENIYKLHGSIEKYDHKSNAWLDSLDSIELTLEQVAVQGYRFATSMQKQQFLSENFKKKNLLLVGYSGSDDFDIVPILLNIKSKQKIMWLNYNPVDSSIYVGEDILKKHNHKKFGKSGHIINKLVMKRLRDKNSCFIVQADTSLFLSSMIKALNYDCSKSSKRKSNYVLDPAIYFSERFDLILPNQELIQMMKAALLYTIGDYEPALKIYQPLLDFVNNKSELYLKSKILYEIASCYYNMTPPMYKTALRYSEESFNIDFSNKFNWLFLSADLLARIYRKLGKLDLMQKIYERLLMLPVISSSNYFIKYQQATIFNNYSVHLFKIGKVNKSIQFAEKSLSLFKQIGDWGGIVSSTMGISTILMESGSIDQSINKLKEVEKIATDLDFFQDLCKINNEMGIAFRYKGDFKTAIDYHSKAARFAKMIVSPLELSRQYYNIGLCEWQRGNLKAAIEFNNNSFEIRDGLQEGEEKWSSISENFQFYGNLFVKMGKYQLAKESFEKSNEFAERVEYARVICDNYCNLLALSMRLDKPREVELFTEKLRYLLTDRYKIFDRWEEIKAQTTLYWLLRGQERIRKMALFNRFRKRKFGKLKKRTMGLDNYIEESIGPDQLRQALSTMYYCKRGCGAGIIVDFGLTGSPPEKCPKCGGPIVPATK